VHSSTKTSSTILSPTALQLSQYLTESKEARSPTEKDIEVDGESYPPRVLSPSAHEFPVSTPLSDTLSHMSRRVVSTTSHQVNNTIYESDLIPYSDYQASKLSYPIGCTVWYKYDNESIRDAKLTSVQIGKVKSVAMNVATRSFVYKIEKDENTLDLVLEDHIAYASGCPVQVTIDDQVLNGKIICPSNLADFSSHNTRYYSVMFRGSGNTLMIEHDVCSDQIKYCDREDESEEMVAIAVGESVCNNPFSWW